MIAAADALIANLIWLMQMADGEWIFYSRANDHHASLRSHLPNFYRLRIHPTDSLRAMERAKGRPGLLMYDEPCIFEEFNRSNLHLAASAIGTSPRVTSR